MAKQDVRFREMIEPAEQGQGMTNEKYWRDKAALHERQGQHHLAHGAVFRARIAAQLSPEGERMTKEQHNAFPNGRWSASPVTVRHSQLELRAVAVCDRFQVVSSQVQARMIHALERHRESFGGACLQMIDQVMGW